MRDQKFYTLLDAAAAANAYKWIAVEDFRNIIFSVATDGGGDAALTIKFIGSISEIPPVPTSAQSVTNMFDYVQVKDYEDAAAIDGETGISVATADDYRIVEANVNGLKWIGVIVTARTEGEVTVTARAFNSI